MITNHKPGNAMNKSSKQKNFVITGIQSWDIEIGSNCKNIALELSKKHKVLYVNKAESRISFLKNRKKLKFQKRLSIINGKTSPFQRINENLIVFDPRFKAESLNWMPKFLFDWFNHWENKSLAKEITYATRYLGMEDYHMFCDSDMFSSFHLKDLLKPKSFTYYTRDNLMTVPYWKKHGQFFEPEIMNKADLVVSNSPHLRDLALKHSDNAHYIGQGCETSEYAEAHLLDTPEELNGLKRPIVGYAGLLSSRRLSIQTLWKLAKEMPGASIVLVGPEEGCFQQSNLHDLPNVYFTGKVSPSRLPSFISAFDVCINPQVTNELTKGNYPRKIDEYLAAGKPVVATNTPTMKIFESYCALANSDEEYCTLVKQELKNDNPLEAEGRKKFAAKHSWENSVRSLINKLNNHLKAA